MVLTQVLCNGNVMYYQKPQILHINIKIVFTSFYFYIVDSNIFDFALQYFILPPLRLIIEVMRLSMDRIVLFITSTGILLIVLITLSLQIVCMIQTVFRVLKHQVLISLILNEKYFQYDLYPDFLPELIVKLRLCVT